MVLVSTTAASSGVVVLLGGVLLGCFLLGLCLPGVNLLRSSEERQQRHRRCFLLVGVALEVLGSAPLVVVWLVRRR
jgi:hypothetical protein